MVPYVVSFGVGLAVGAIYGLVSVRSPAPPVIALVGLLGILVGEVAVTRLKERPADAGSAQATLPDSAKGQM